MGKRGGTRAALAVALPAGLMYLKQKHPLIWHDLWMLKRSFDIVQRLELLNLSGKTNVDVFEEHARSNPEKACVLYQDERYSYGEVNERADDLARWIGSRRRVGRGDVVAVLMHNEAAFTWMWLALAKLGVISSLLNTNLKPAALLECIRLSGAKSLLCGSEFLPAVRRILPNLREIGIEVWLLGDANPEDGLPVDVFVVDTKETRALPIPRVKARQEETASYIFTSGTTGLPKPIHITFWRIISASHLSAPYSPYTADDVVYTALPLYHSAALLVGMLTIFLAGGTLAIARKFSASRFWDDIRKHEATIFQYIGELCRYLLAQPERPDDGHYSKSIRMAVGNGLRPDIWDRFKTRFNIQHIAEFYGSTELSHNFVNTDGKRGVVGRYGWFHKTFSDNIELVEYDYATGQPLRDSNGRCIHVPVGQPGLLLIQLNRFTIFDGYAGKPDETAKKIARDVKVPGDAYFNTADLMLIDAEGYLHFRDRLGDTFRWKGENVSTLEVSHIICQDPSVLEANVYGVEVPGHDGRAGMASVSMRHGRTFDADALYRQVTESLPRYARPLFVRLMPVIPTTTTFKHQKSELVRQGFDVDVIADPIFLLNDRKKTYSPMDTADLARILAGNSKL